MKSYSIPTIRSTRREFLRAVGLGLGATALAPYALDPSPVAAQGSGGTTPRFDGVTLQVSAVEANYMTGFKLFEGDLQQRYGIKMAYDTVPVDQLYQRDMLEFSGGTASHDLILVQPGWLADYSRHLEPLEPMARKFGVDLALGDDVLPAFRTYMYWDNVLLAVPFDADQLQFLYNKVAFDRPANRTAFRAKYGYDLKPPETWDQYREMAEFFTATDWVGDGKKRFGAVESWRRGIWCYSWWLCRFASYGGVYFDDNMKPLVNTPPAKKALDNMMAMRQSTPPAIATAPNPEMRAIFANGDAAMTINFSSLARVVMTPAASKIVGQVGVGPVPGVRRGNELYRRPSFGGGGWLLAVPRYAKNRDAAFLALAYLSQPGPSLALALDFRTTVDPWRRSSLQSPKWYEIWPEYKDYVRQLLAVTEETPRTGIPDLQIPGSEQYRSALATEINVALVGDKQPQQALDDAAKAWEEVTNRFGRDQQKAYWSKQNEALKKLGIVYRPELAGS
jgi:multiple sugar transport system substrate-binding protein